MDVGPPKVCRFGRSHQRHFSPPATQVHPEKPMKSLQLLPHRSDARLAALITHKILLKLPNLSSVLDIGCGDGIVGSLLPATLNYRGIDLSDASIYEQNTNDPRISYCSPDQLNSLLTSSEPADAVLMLDVLEHTREFSDLFESALELAKQYVIVSLPNELFILDRLRILAGKEHPAHSLDLISLPVGFKHQYLINIAKARRILGQAAQLHSYELAEEWQQPLVAKNRLVQPWLWLLRKLSTAQLWSTGSVFVFKHMS
jgi:SAM-dependent methyltransferase